MSKKSMNRFDLVVLAVAVFALLGLFPLSLAAQEAGEPEGGADEFTGVSAEDMSEIESILEGDESLSAGGTFSYEPGDRRDPFRSLLATVERPALRGPRPEGIPGLLIDEIDLTGILRTADGWVVQIRAADTGRSELLRVGDQLYDGDVVSIRPDEVVFKQIVNDPTALKPFREVVKKLNP